MGVHIYPFNSISFDNKTSVLIDACFLLALLYENDNKHKECEKVLKELLDRKCQLYVTNIVSSEVLNQILYRLFASDMRYKVDGITPLNSRTHIGVLISNLTKNDKNDLRAGIINRVNRINFKYYFNQFYKDNRLRKFLKIYFEKATYYHEALEKKLGVKYISSNRAMLALAKDYMKNDMLGVNDANHLAAATQNELTYLLTLDGDFVYLTSKVKVGILKI